MLIQKKFKRLKVNAGFTFNTATGKMAVKVSNTHYRISGTPTDVKADPNKVVWVDSFQVKRWYQW